MDTLALQHPERIHPSLWKASQLAHPCNSTISTGYPNLDNQLPGYGWPTNALIEIMMPRSGLGEIQLLKPALLAQQHERTTIFLAPPHTPSSLCLNQWFSAPRHILWIKPESVSHTLWAAEKILQHHKNATLVCWIPIAYPASIHRLHLAARQGNTLFFCLRPLRFATQSSVAPLRLSLEPTCQGLNIQIIKRRGPLSKTTVFLNLFQHRTDQSLQPSLHHDSLDQYSPAPDRPFSTHTDQTHRDRLAAIHT